jgi:hypothetical protein
LFRIPVKKFATRWRKTHWKMISTLCVFTLAGERTKVRGQMRGEE